jgi:hypothetical protein
LNETFQSEEILNSRFQNKAQKIKIFGVNDSTDSAHKKKKIKGQNNSLKMNDQINYD